MRIALYQPDIPQNAGTIIRTAACLGLAVDLIEPCGFVLSDRHFRRAGLDYLAAATIVRHSSWDAFRAAHKPPARLVLLTTRAEGVYTNFVYRETDILLVGRESGGVPNDVHATVEARVRVPLKPQARALNVAVAAAMVLGEALRQTGGAMLAATERPQYSAGGADQAKSRNGEECVVMGSAAEPMLVPVLSAKIHRATVTAADMHYEGSITIDRGLMVRADLVAFQQVQIYNITNGARFETYVIEGEAESGTIQINGAAAHLARPGDLIIIAAYTLVSRAQATAWQPRIVHLDAENRPIVAASGTLRL